MKKRMTIAAITAAALTFAGVASFALAAAPERPTRDVDWRDGSTSPAVHSRHHR